MAITNTQQARQLYRIGGVGGRAKEGPVERGGGRDPSAQFGRTPEEQAAVKTAAQPELRRREEKIGLGNKTGLSSLPSLFGQALNLIKVRRGNEFAQDFNRSLRNLNRVDINDETDSGEGIPLWAQLGFSSEAEYLAALARAQAPSTTDQETEEKDEGLRLAFRANGGRIGFRGGDAARSDAASGRDAGRADPGGGVERGGGDRDRRRVEQYTKPPTFVGGNGGGGEGPKPFLVADALTTPTAGQFGFNLMELKRLKDAGYDPEEVAEGGYGEDLLKALRIPIAKGGIADTVVGGEMDFESARQMYGLGKLVKKVTRTVKKIAKSPIGKAALIYAGTGALGNLAGGSGLGGMFRGFTSPSSFLGGASKIFSKEGLRNIAFGAPGEFLGSPRGLNTGIMTKGTSGLFGFGGEFSPLKAIGITSALAGLLTPEQEDEAQALSTGEGIDIDAARRMILQAGTSGDKRALVFRADGGRIEYQEGSKEPVAKKTMPLLDMGGKEMDLREDGGFVPIGRMEKADDVPARLSKNEFVFTADAVRNAGDGDVDKGAEVMYNMMKNLEAGGDVSEESQGLEGARRMFQTSQRLEEVI